MWVSAHAHDPLQNRRQEDLSSLKREIAILHRCRSDYVVEFRDCFFADNELWIVMEFCMGGSVADMLDATERTLTEPQVSWRRRHRRAGKSPHCLSLTHLTH